MAIVTATAGNVNTGRDIVITLIAPANAGGNTVVNGGNTVLTNVMMFTYKQDTIDIMKTKIDGRTILADLPRFWSGTIEFERADNTLDIMFSKLEDNWYRGGVFNLGSMSVTVTNPPASFAGASGGGGTMNFADVSLRFEDGGQFKGDDTVRVRLAWRAAIRTI